MSAEIWGRNLYADDRLPLRIYAVNDSEDGRDIGPMQLAWTLETQDGAVLASGPEAFPAVEYYGREYIEPEVRIPDVLPARKMHAVLRLKLSEGGVVLSENEYGLLLAERSWAACDADCSVRLLDADGLTAPALESIGVDYCKVASVSELCGDPGLCVVSGLMDCSPQDASLLRNFVASGGRLLFLSSDGVAMKVFPEYLTGRIVPTEGDIVVMERKENPVFDGIGPLELRYFNNGRREIPLACRSVLKAVRDDAVTELASQMKIHAYIDGGTPEDRIARIESMRGLTLMRIDDGTGSAVISTMCTDKAVSDPVAGRILANLCRAAE